MTHLCDCMSVAMACVKCAIYGENIVELRLVYRPELFLNEHAGVCCAVAHSTAWSNFWAAATVACRAVVPHMADELFGGHHAMAQQTYSLSTNGVRVSALYDLRRMQN